MMAFWIAKDAMFLHVDNNIDMQVDMSLNPCPAE